MKTNLKELSNLFKLKDSDYRQLKIGLNNKIIFINDNDVEIINDEIKNLLNEFRNNGCFDIKEASTFYNISKFKLEELVKEGAISSYRLISGKGSKILFLRSELEKENEIILKHIKGDYIKRKKIGYVLSNILKRLIKLDEFESKKKYFEIFLEYHYDCLTTDEIAEKRDLSRERVNQCLAKANHYLFTSLDTLVSLKTFYANFKQKHEELNSENTRLKKYLAEHKNIDDFILEIYKIKIKDLEVSTRTLNVLKPIYIENIGDLISYTRDGMNNLLQWRGCGKKTIYELKDVLMDYDFSYNNGWYYKNHKLLNIPEF